MKLALSETSKTRFCCDEAQIMLYINTVKSLYNYIGMDHVLSEPCCKGTILQIVKFHGTKKHPGSHNMTMFVSKSLL